MRAAFTVVRSLTVLALVFLCVATTVSGQLDSKSESELHEVLQQYSAALESLDAEAVKKLQPSMDLESLKKAFREMRALDVTIDNVKVLSVDGVLARISCRVSQTITPKAGSKQTTTVPRVLRLRKGQTSWVIDAFER